MQNRFTFGMATVVMLVLLRLNIGWHFYSEGAKHRTETNWSSEGFLRAAKGPLAPMFQAVLPGDYGLKQVMQETAANPKAYQAWGQNVVDTWEGYLERFGRRYGLDEKQQKSAQGIVRRRQAQFQSWLAENQEDIVSYVRELKRLGEAEAQKSAADVPYQKKRLADKQTELDKQTKGWLTQVRSIEDKMQHDLEELLNNEKIPAQGGLPPVDDANKLKTVDTVMTWGILGIGACLILGLFTRLACVLGAAFLLSVVLTQPFWVTDTTPTFNQFVEMFALLTLATTHVGRWGGLDFFIHQYVRRPSAAESQS